MSSLPPMRRTFAIISIAIVASSMLLACGDDEESKNGLDKAACAIGTPAGSASGVNLPSGFPQVEGVQFSGSTTAGPTTITAGIASKKLGDVFNDYKQQLAKSPFSVTKSEKDKDDAEVNFASADATGQVKLRDCEGGKTAVQVTARPK